MNEAANRMTDKNKAIDAAVRARLAFELERLLAFALKTGLVEKEDIIPARNALLDLFGLAEPAEADTEALMAEVPDDSPAPILERILDLAFEIGLLPENNGTYRDLLDARIMGLLMPRASETNRTFWRLAREQSMEAATDYFYRQSIAANYIMMDRVAKNEYWLADTDYGPIEITVNLSKPEKDPKEIALLKNAPSSSYPKCLLCAENAGYAGRINHPARQNHRIIPLELCGEPWYFQYSPYVYYNEHSIVLHRDHIPMKITPLTFRRLLAFIDQFPHYFIGSNADLPIVGGSILNHEHYQAGRHRFPMEKAPVEAEFVHADFAGVKAGIVRWPLSVLRLRCAPGDRERLLAAADRVLALWRAYSDPAVRVLASSGSVPHNTITPIARINGAGELELDLVLRNNRTDGEHPDGIFHPSRRLHHIKKENIGLIEVMGLAVLPGRLKTELAGVQRILTGEDRYDAAELAEERHPLAKHAAWIAELVAARGTAMHPADAEALLRTEVGRKFADVLADCGVFKRDEAGHAAFRRFLAHAGFTRNG
jgi:UDPglucose--hexose-1-phosphate uridylyltransferase